jgi:hypothetical protein
MEIGEEQGWEVLEWKTGHAEWDGRLARLISTGIPPTPICSEKKLR